MKKILSIFAMAAILCGTFAACDTIGKDNEGTDGTEQTPGEGGENEGGEEKPQKEYIDDVEVTENGLSFTVNTENKLGYTYVVVDYVSLTYGEIPEEEVTLDMLNEMGMLEMLLTGQAAAMGMSAGFGTSKESIKFTAEQLAYIDAGTKTFYILAADITKEPVEVEGIQMCEFDPASAKLVTFQAKWDGMPME